MSGATYTPSVSGIAITSGGAANSIGGGRGISTFIFICAIVGIGTTIANTKRIVPKSNFFILLPPCMKSCAFCFLTQGLKVQPMGFAQNSLAASTG